MYTIIMKDEELIPRTPLDNIAEIVRRQFREQSLKDLNKTLAKNKKPIQDNVSIPELPKEQQMQSSRIQKSPPTSKSDDDDPSTWLNDAEDSDTLSEIEMDGSIYTDMMDGTPGESPLTAEEAALQVALAVRKGHEKGKPDIDWHLVKLLYVYAGWTYERIARETNVAFSLVRLNGRKGRWPDSRDAYRAEQSQKVQEKIALEEDRLRDWQMLKRRQAGIDGLNWLVKAISNLRDDASPESIAKLGGLLDRMLSSVTGLNPVEGTPGGVSVSVNTSNVAMGSMFPSNSPQAKLAAVWDKKVGESDTEHTRRLALTIRDLYIECERSGLYEDLKLDSEGQRQLKLKNRLGLDEIDMPMIISER